MDKQWKCNLSNSKIHTFNLCIPYGDICLSVFQNDEKLPSVYVSKNKGLIKKLDLHNTWPKKKSLQKNLNDIRKQTVVLHEKKPIKKQYIYARCDSTFINILYYRIYFNGMIKWSVKVISLVCKTFIFFFPLSVFLQICYNHHSQTLIRKNVI